MLIAAVIGLAGCSRDDDEGIRIPPHNQAVLTLSPEEARQSAQQVMNELPIELADGLNLQLWAPEQLVQDPVAIDIDNQGRLYYIRSNRIRNSEFDIRGHQNWMIEVIGFETVEDRRAFLKRELAPERSAENTFLEDMNGDGSRDWRDLLVEKEQIYRLEDTDGDGFANESRLFVEGFNTEVSDVAGGLMVDGDTVYLGVAPDLWRIVDKDGDGVADVMKSLVHGFQTHIGFGAHGMSGQMMGPDGKIYWNIGDIGSNIVDANGKRWENPHRGAIFRANPDGSDFEVFSFGNRNVHEFTFDDYGNLIGVDNDGDHAGEHERIVYLTDGSDTGWRINWQFGKYIDPDNNTYKVWMDEGLYKPRFEGQAAFITPPVAAYNAGPAGMVYNPGTALSERWKNHFFVAEFVGSTRTRISAFTLKPKGATFELVEEKDVVRGPLATGLAFGPDGALYFADWVEGWGAKDRGRIWKLDDTDSSFAAIRAETQRLLAEDFSIRNETDLQDLLHHADQRVRMKAQFALVNRGEAGATALLAAVQQQDHQLGRIHGIWGLGQLARKDQKFAEPLVAFLSDADPEIRAQTAKVLGDAAYAPSADALIPLLKDAEARPRFFAAQALGRIGHEPAIQPIIDMLQANNDEDAYLRHAGSLALARIGKAEPIVALAEHPSRAVRIAAVVALRRMEHPGVARFLEDEDEYIVTEAARAINDDNSIEEAIPALADLLKDTQFTNEALIRRAINANLRLGTPENAQVVADYAARTGAPEQLRAEALASLGVWPKPSVLDRVDGRWRGKVERDPAGARQAIATIIEPLLTGGSATIKAAAAETAGRLHYEAAAEPLLALVERDASPDVRIAALQALNRMGDTRLEGAIRAALVDRDGTVRMAALELIPSLDMPEATLADMLSLVLTRGTIPERQTALATLGTLQGPRSQEVLSGLMDQLIAGDIQPEIQLDVLEAAEKSQAEPVKAKVAQYQASKPEGDLIASYREVLRGGDARRGGRIFYQHPGAQCIRCHAVGGRGGEVGPDLTNIGARTTREHLVESLADPSAQISPGYGTVSVTLRDGQTISGTLREEAETQLTLLTVSGEARNIAKSEIAERNSAPSSMPPMGTVLTRREMRDLIEFLATAAQ